MDIFTFTPVVDLHVGDCLEVLTALPEKHFHSCVTSPPYFHLRNYDAAGQIGQEPLMVDYLSSLVAVFGAVRRVLRDDGTLWINLGDGYAQKRQDGLAARNLMGIPWRLAFALQSDGWILRSDIIWEKPNAMPVSVRDRPTPAHEYIFLLAKSSHYYYDMDAIREPMKSANDPRNRADFKARRVRNVGGRTDGFTRASSPMSWPEGGRNKRTVWTVPTQPAYGAHFAAYPPRLIEPCILASCPPGGDVIDPFAGTGTTGLVASQLGRRATLIELNQDYAALIQRRLGDLVRRL